MNRIDSCSHSVVAYLLAYRGISQQVFDGPSDSDQLLPSHLLA